jgi:hypothetical protein
MKSSPSPLPSPHRGEGVNCGWLDLAQCSIYCFCVIFGLCLLIVAEDGVDEFNFLC